MKELLCQAFCSSLDVRSVPAGFAVRTPYENSDGDPLLVYFVREGRDRWRIEDDGTQVPLLEANGVDLGGKARGGAFEALLQEYGAVFDRDARTLRISQPLSEPALGIAAVRFVALLLRLQDLLLMTPQVVRSTFREDALAAIHDAFGTVADLKEGAPLSPELVGHEADILVSVPARSPLAIYLATSEERALQALIAKMEAESYRKIDGRVVLILERAKANPVKESTYSLALARLDGVLSFRESKQDTLQRLSQFVGAPIAAGRLQ
jgi:hypothetical protein